MSEHGSQLGHGDYEVLDDQVLFDGFFSVHGLRLRHRRFSGEWSREIERELFVRNDATCVLPYDPVRREVVLLEQFRAGALGREQSPWLVELIAGINESGELPLDVAHREAREEADLSLLELEPICRYLVSPGGSNELVHLYCARVDASGAGGVHGLDSEDEDIRVSVWPLDEALSALNTGTINNAPAIIALQWLVLNEARLRQQWEKAA